MSRFGSFLVALALLSSPSLAVAQGTAPTDADTEKARALYDEGRKAYRRGDMKTALDRFEQAYDLTENPIILYNIGLTYKRLYDTSNEPEHLRKGKVVLENFKLELMRDPGLGNMEDVDNLIAEIEEQLASQGSGEGSSGSGPSPDSESGTEPEGPEAEGSLPPPPNQDAGKKLRVAGIASLGAGGALGIGAAVGAIISQRRYFAEVDALDQAEVDEAAAGCPEAGGETCDQYATLKDELADRANAYRRNIGVFAGALGGAAVLSIGAGAALVAIGVKRKNSPVADLRVTPHWGGVSIAGRF
jgi:hypothetical protein